MYSHALIWNAFSSISIFVCKTEFINNFEASWGILACYSSEFLKAKKSCQDILSINLSHWSMVHWPSSSLPHVMEMPILDRQFKKKRKDTNHKPAIGWYFFPMVYWVPTCFMSFGSLIHWSNTFSEWSMINGKQWPTYQQFDGWEFLATNQRIAYCSMLQKTSLHDPAACCHPRK